MTSGVDGPAWRARYPDLSGKVAVVSGAGDPLRTVVAALATNGMAIAVVAPSRETIDGAIEAAEAGGVAVFGVVADPTVDATWGRVMPHAEQRLGPIDVVVALGTDADRRAAVSAVAPDMSARRRGVVIEVGEPGDLLGLPHDVRRRVVATASDVDAAEIAAAVAFCASDVLTVPLAEIVLTAEPNVNSLSRGSETRLT